MYHLGVAPSSNASCEIQTTRHCDPVRPCSCPMPSRPINDYSPCLTSSLLLVRTPIVIFLLTQLCIYRLGLR